MLAVITGGTSGIGAAVAEALARKGVRVLAVGRKPAALAAVAARHKNIVSLGADVTAVEGVASVADWVARNSDASKLAAVVHSAGILGPIKPLLKLTGDELARTLDINVKAPLTLTQALLPHFAPDARVLTLSSAAAIHPIDHWGAYCISKAALAMATKVLKSEAASSTGIGAPRLWVASVEPGMVATPMQDEVQAAPPDYPFAPIMAQLYANKQLLQEAADGSVAARPPPMDGMDDPRNAAMFLRWLLLDVPAEEFGSSAESWDIHKAEYQARWAGAKW